MYGWKKFSGNLKFTEDLKLKVFVVPFLNSKGIIPGLDCFYSLATFSVPKDLPQGPFRSFKKNHLSCHHPREHAHLLTPLAWRRILEVTARSTTHTSQLVWANWKRKQLRVGAVVRQEGNKTWHKQYPPNKGVRKPKSPVARSEGADKVVLSTTQGTNRMPTHTVLSFSKTGAHFVLKSRANEI